MICHIDDQQKSTIQSSLVEYMIEGIGDQVHLDDVSQMGMLTAL